MKWLVILFWLDGEPAILSGWEPLQVESAECDSRAEFMTKYLVSSEIEYTAVGCLDTLDQASIDALVSSFGTSL